jgi:hypothetical protein
VNRKDGPFTDTMFIRQAPVVMSDVPKRIKRLVREWAGIAHDRDLHKALSDLRTQFDRWDRGEIMRLSSTISCINSIRTRRGRSGRDAPRPTLSRQSYQRGRRVFFAQRNCRAVPRDIPHFPARVVTPARTIPIVLEELSGARKRPMIRPMPTMGRPQRRYDHRLRHLVQRTGDVPVATDLGVPRSTARGWVTELVTGSADLSRRGRDGNSRLLEDPTDLTAC